MLPQCFLFSEVETPEWPAQACITRPTTDRLWVSELGLAGPQETF